MKYEKEGKMIKRQKMEWWKKEKGNGIKEAKRRERNINRTTRPIE